MRMWRRRWRRTLAAAWRLDQAPGGGNIDGVVALAMAVERAAEPPQEVKLVGWL
jgi:hypothetical protein